MKRIRSPILVALGHVDHGKTSLLDKVRGTAIAKTEPGLITQYISASYIPIDVLKRICGDLFRCINVQITIPGLLWIDSPGHEAFTTLRKRGGAIADIAILVVDINEGFKPQTVESINYLKQFKTPFIVALTKIDRLMGWRPEPNRTFIASIKDQSERVQEAFEEKLYRVIGSIAEHGFSSERYDRVSDYTKQVAIVPVSSVTGEGIPDLLMVITGLAQRYLKDSLEIEKGEGKGTILEVKDIRGLGQTIDVVIYDGEVKRGDYLVIGGHKIVKTRIKAILEPSPLKELRIDKGFTSVESVVAAAGIKISAPLLEDVIPGSPIRAVRKEGEVAGAEKEIEKEIEEVEFESDGDGVYLKADTLGSLEALIKTLRDRGIRIRKAHIGNVTKMDVMEMRSLDDPMIFAFGLRISPEIEKLAKDNVVRVFHSNIIYSLVEEYEKWINDKKAREEEKMIAQSVKPGEMRILPGYVFRQCRPAVFGVEIMRGTISPGVRIRKEDGPIGEIKEIQLRGENVHEAKIGEKVAISVIDVTVGKEVKEGDIINVFLNDRNIEMLMKIYGKLRNDEKELLEDYNKNKAVQ